MELLFYTSMWQLLDSPSLLNAKNLHHLGGIDAIRILTPPKEDEMGFQMDLRWKTGLSACCDVAITKNFVFQQYAGDMLHKYSSQSKQKYRKRNNPPKFLNIYIMFPRGLWKSKAEIRCTIWTASSVQASKLRKPEVAQLEVKFDLFSSIGLGGAQQLHCISQWKPFFIHSA